MSVQKTERDLEAEVAEVVRTRRENQGRSDLAEVEGSSAREEWGVRGRDAVMRVPVSVRIVLGVASMPLQKLLSLGRGSTIPLDRKVGDPVDIMVNDSVVARGEVVVIDEEASRFAVSIREVVGGAES